MQHGHKKATGSEVKFENKFKMLDMINNALQEKNKF